MSKLYCPECDRDQETCQRCEDFAEMAYDESARWDISDSNAKWSAK